MENDERKLFQNYKKTKSKEARNKIVEEYLPLVSKIARMMPQYYISHIDSDDLESFGYFGLIDAVEKFDLDKNVKFETYASLRIRGAIIDHLRKQDFLPRSVRKKQKIIEEKIKEYQNKYSETPNDKQISKMTGLKEKDVNKVLEDTAFNNMTSLEELISSNLESKTSARMDSPENKYLEDELKQRLVECINSLKDREQKILSLYYYEELTLKEIGEVLDISESRVSQLLSKIIMVLKKKLLIKT